MELQLLRAPNQAVSTEAIQNVMQQSQAPKSEAHS